MACGQMKNGNILINGRLGTLLEGFVQDGVVTDPDIDGKAFSGKYIKYTGDIALNGKGGLYLNAEKNRDLL
jgi:formylmethanofuran dehydrogenase subunit C